MFNAILIISPNFLAPINSKDFNPHPTNNRQSPGNIFFAYFPVNSCALCQYYITTIKDGSTGLCTCVPKQVYRHACGGA